MANSVLVTHTSDEALSFFKNIFEKKGYTVHYEIDGAKALINIVETKPEFVLLGTDTPTLSGIDLLRIIKNSSIQPIVCLIGEDGADSETASINDADAFITLPLDDKAAEETIDKLFTKYKIKSRKFVQKKRLHQTAAFLTHLLENIRVAIISVDTTGKILSFNRKAQKLWGYQRNFVIGRHFDILCIKPNRKKCAASLISETITKGSYEGMLYFERADGTTFPGNLQTSIIKGNESDEGIVVVIRDLTKQRELEDKLLEKEKLATLGIVVEGVAHEVRNPLISIGGFARRILKKVKPDFPYRNYLKVIVDDVSRLEAMVKDIESYVHFTKLHKPNFKKERIQKIIETAVDLVDKKKLKHIMLNFEFDPTLPSFYLDVGYLVEMFFNLIENAIEAMQEGGALTLKTLRDNHTACIVKIIDCGCGIPDEQMDEIFNLFYTTKMSGVGLGLAKAHIIVDEHCGKITVESDKNKGTIVTVTLPLERRQKVRR